MSHTNGTRPHEDTCTACQEAIPHGTLMFTTGSGVMHERCWDAARSAQRTQPPQTVLARVWYDLKGPEGPYSYEEVETALKRAMIPTQAPYDDWEGMIGRALTLLPPRRGEALHQKSPLHRIFRSKIGLYGLEKVFKMRLKRSY